MRNWTTSIALATAAVAVTAGAAHAEPTDTAPATDTPPALAQPTGLPPAPPFPPLELRSVASPLENQLAAKDSADVLGQAAVAGPLLGATAGAVAGVVVAGASCVVLTAGCVLTALPIIGAFAAGGAVAGTVVAGGLAAAWGANNYLETLQAEPGTSRYNHGVNGAGVPDSKIRVPKLPLGSGSSSGSGSLSGS